MLTTEQHKQKRFQEVTLPHLDAVYNLARWLTRNDDDAQDIAQEAYLRALKFFDGFHGDDGRAWLLTIVRNTYYTWLKKNRIRVQEESFDEEIHGLGDGSTTLVDSISHGNPEVLLMQQASKQIINKALEQLPVESREVIVLRELEDLSYKEIASIVEVPMGTVMSRLARARKLLRDQLEKMNSELQT
jgi:RNA polymerase sigma-70 factor, ECF subfamily